MRDTMIIIISMISIFIVIQILTYISRINYIKEKWGKRPVTDFISISRRKYLEENFEELINFYGNKSVVDDYTYNDLDLYKIFEQMDSTFSNPGSSALYYRLRTLDKDSEDRRILNEREKYFENNPDDRTKILYQFFGLGKKNETSIINFIKNIQIRNQIEFPFHILLGVLPIVLILLYVLRINQAAIVMMFPLIGFNFAYTFYRKSSYENDYLAANYLTNIIKVANKISKYDIPEIERIKDRLSGIKSMRFMSYLSVSESMVSGDILAFFFNIIFMIPFISHGMLVRIVTSNREQIIELWKELGEIEASIAILNYKQTLDNGYCEVEFTEQYEIIGTNIYHPLLENPVKNDVNWNNNILITGSNASGKSTYVKSVAVNAILAQSIYIALAESFKLKKARVFSSMSIKDDIVRGDSYFIAEIKSLKRIIEDVEEGNKSYYFIDEILKGTNTRERIAASYSIMNYLAKNEVLSFVATHDIELTILLKEAVRNVHFREHFTEEGAIDFDYKLYEGPSKTTNALKLLEIYDFPAEIIDEAKSYEL